MLELTPRQIVEELDKYIVGQADAKRAIAVAIRNRWRRQRVGAEMRDEIGPKNMMMIGPTGVGKTEIARRLATLTGAPFVKVDATKYTEVGYYGRDVESMARELVENAIGIVRAQEREKIADQAKEAAEKRLVELLVEKFEKENRENERLARKNEKIAAANLVEKTSEKAPEKAPESASKTSDDATQNAANPQPFSWEALQAIPFDPNNPGKNFSEMMKRISSALGANVADGNAFFGAASNDSTENSATDSTKNSSNAAEPRVVDRAEIETRLRLGEFENETVSIVEERRATPLIMGGVGIDGMSNDIQNMLESISPRRNSRRELPVSQARPVLLDLEAERLLDKEKLNARAVELAENVGIIFIDEIDKIVGSEGGHGADVSRQGVQRDLLPIVEGTTVQTKYGFMSTEHVLFIAAGAFHRAKPSDLTPELQGRFPIRVELSELKKEDFVRILTEPKSALTKQYAELMKTENVELVFEDDAIDALAGYAAEANLTTQNIGARRLCTMMELLLEDLNFEAPEMKMGRVVVNGAYVREKIERVVRDEDLSKFVL